jgi:hypothetical protein
MATSWLYNEDLEILASFEEWAKDHLGQGYSLEREEGSYIDRVTRWAYKAWTAATLHERAEQ